MNSISTYKKFAKYYDLYVGEFTNDLPIYLSFCDIKDNILEVGCGTGRVLKALLENGNKVTGVDVSDEMLKIAEKNLESSIQHGKLILKNHNFNNEPLKEMYNKCFITFFTFNYLLNNPVEFVKNVYACMLPNAVILADLFYPKGLNDNSIQGKWKTKKFKNIILRDKREIKDKIETRIQVFDEGDTKIEIETKRRYYSPLEVKFFFEKAGFINIEFAIGYNNLKFYKTINDNKLETNYFIKAIKL